MASERPPARNSSKRHSGETDTDAQRKRRRSSQQDQESQRAPQDPAGKDASQSAQASQTPQEVRICLVFGSRNEVDKVVAEEFSKRHYRVVFAGTNLGSVPAFSKTSRFSRYINRRTLDERRVAGVFSELKELEGAPSVVIWNRASTTQHDDSCAIAALEGAESSFESFPTTPCTFICADFGYNNSKGTIRDRIRTTIQLQSGRNDYRRFYFVYQVLTGVHGDLDPLGYAQEYMKCVNQPKQGDWDISFHGSKDQAQIPGSSTGRTPPTGMPGCPAQSGPMVQPGNLPQLSPSLMPLRNATQSKSAMPSERAKRHTPMQLHSETAISREVNLTHPGWGDMQLGDLTRRHGTVTPARSPYPQSLILKPSYEQGQNLMQPHSGSRQFQSPMQHGNAIQQNESPVDFGTSPLQSRHSFPSDASNQRGIDKQSGGSRRKKREPNKSVPQSSLVSQRNGWVQVPKTKCKACREPAGRRCDVQERPYDEKCGFCTDKRRKCFFEGVERTVDAAEYRSGSVARAPRQESKGAKQRSQLANESRTTNQLPATGSELPPSDDAYNNRAMENHSEEAQERTSEQDGIPNVPGNALSNPIDVGSSDDSGNNQSNSPQIDSSANASPHFHGDSSGEQKDRAKEIVDSAVDMVSQTPFDSHPEPNAGSSSHGESTGEQKDEAKKIVDSARATLSPEPFGSPPKPSPEQGDFSSEPDADPDYIDFKNTNAAPASDQGVSSGAELPPSSVVDCFDETDTPFLDSDDAKLDPDVEPNNMDVPKHNST